MSASTPTLALSDLLAATSSVASLIGGTGDSARLFSLAAPNDAEFPLITYRTISDLPASSTSDGPSGRRVRVELDMYALDYRAIQALAEAVRALLCPESGTPGAVREHVVSGWALRVTPAFSQDIYERDTKLYRVQADYMIWAGQQS